MKKGCPPHVHHKVGFILPKRPAHILLPAVTIPAALWSESDRDPKGLAWVKVYKGKLPFIVRSLGTQGLPGLHVGIDAMPYS